MRNFKLLGNCAYAKSGVSLVVVLLLMLVATIAATATYKWITSEARSSGSRMLQREAYQAANAGIEASRAWMATHGNDVGALIKVYKDNGNKPVNMTAQVKNLDNVKQEFEVYLVGVNTNEPTYKLKLVAKGYARGGRAEYDEAAIFNVGGLYQVKVPDAEREPSDHNYDYAYFGGSTENHGNMQPTSMLINGDWKGNPNNITTKFVVTGNATLSGNNLNVGKQTCVGGNLSSNNGFTSAGDLFVGGNAPSFTATIAGSVYFNGDVAMGSQANPGFNIGGDLWLNGELKTDQGAVQPTINGNLCLSEDAVLFSNGKNQTFKANGNVWMPGSKNLYTGTHIDDGNMYTKIVLSGSDKDAYIKYARPYKYYKNDLLTLSFNDYCEQFNGYGYGCAKFSQYSPYSQPIEEKSDKYFWYYTEDGDLNASHKEVHYVSSYYYMGYYAGKNPFVTYMPYGGNIINEYHYNGNVENSPYCIEGETISLLVRPKCYVSPWFKISGKLNTSLPDKAPFTCAEHVKTDCDTLWEKKEGCPNSYTKDYSTWPAKDVPSATKAQYKVDDMLKNGYNSFKQYAKKGCAKDITTWNTDVSQKMNECYSEMNAEKESKKNLYNGYLVVSVKSVDKKDPTEPLRGKFIIIWEDPIDQQGLPPTDGDRSYVLLYLKKGGTGSIQPSKSGGTYNYFIFTEESLDNILFNNGTTFRGSVYAKAENCSRVSDITIDKIDYNKALVDDLIQNSILCDAKKGSCGGAPVGPESSSSTSGSSGTSPEGFGKTDDYYIAAAPQLIVSLESEYRNKESFTKSEVKTLEPSAIVLPRVVYLATNPVGYLKDYYKVVPLNTDDEISGEGANCSGIPGTGKLGELSKGLYKCTVTRTIGSKSVGPIPFFVVVSGTSEQPEVNFKETNVEVAKGNSVTATLVVPESRASEEFKVTVTKPVGDGWDITAFSGVNCDDGNNTCEVTLPASTAEKDVFSIKNNNAKDFIMTFIQQCEGCRIGPNKIETFFTSTKPIFARKEIKEYCSGGNSCSSELLAKVNYPECYAGNTEWVRISGNDCDTDTRNNLWRCEASGTVQLNHGASVENCESLLPADYKLDTFNENGINYLYASLVKKLQTVHLAFAKNSSNPIDNNTKIVANYTYNGESKTATCTYSAYKEDSEAEGCVLHAFAGDRIELEAVRAQGGDDTFNYFECDGGSCPSTDKLSIQNLSYNLTGSHTMKAHFNESDLHCFFETFNSRTLNENDWNIKPVLNPNNVDKNKLVQMEEVPNYASTLGDQLIMKRIRLNKEAYRAIKDGGVQVALLSTKVPGDYGTLKAQIKLPTKMQLEGSLKKSGLLLRSNGSDTAPITEYMLLNVYSDAGKMYARLCLQKGSFACTDAKELGSVYQSGLGAVLVTATLFNDNGVDKLNVHVKNSDVYSTDINGVEFELKNSVLSGLGDLQRGGKVGLSLSAEDFEVYGIGWKSEDYADLCWDTAPQVKCSFSGNYGGGIVPQDSAVTPWVGLMSWFNASNCDVTYYYKGTDGNCFGYSGKCADSIYKFSTSGPHGIKTNFSAISSMPDSRALVNVNNCHLDELNSQWLNKEETDCGMFYVGKINVCRQDIPEINCSLGSKSFGAQKSYSCEINANNGDAYKNFRGVTLEISNVGYGEIEVVLGSKDGYNNGYKSSKAYKINSTTGTITVPVDLLSDKEGGFNPEYVNTVIIRNLTNDLSSAPTIKGTCNHKLALSNCNASYDATAKKWIVTADVNERDAAGMATVAVNSPSGYNISSKVESGSTTCNEDECSWSNNTLIFNMKLNEGVSEPDPATYKFDIKVYLAGDNSNYKQCTPEFTISSSSVASSSSVGVVSASDCQINKSTINQGETAIFSYTLSNYVDNSGIQVNLYKGSSYFDWSNANKTSFSITEAGEYEIYINGTSSGCKATLTVNQSIESSASSGGETPDVKYLTNQDDLLNVQPGKTYKIMLDDSNNGFNLQCDGHFSYPISNGTSSVFATINGSTEISFDFSNMYYVPLISINIGAANTLLELKIDNNAVNGITCKRSW